MSSSINYFLISTTFVTESTSVISFIILVSFFAIISAISLFLDLSQLLFPLISHFHCIVYYSDFHLKCQKDKHILIFLYVDLKHLVIFSCLHPRFYHQFLFSLISSSVLSAFTSVLFSGNQILVLSILHHSQYFEWIKSGCFAY